MIVIFRKERLEAELAALRTTWKEQMERSLKVVAEESAERLSRDSERIEKEVASRVAAMGKAFAETTAEAENKLSSLREVLNRQDERSQLALVQLQAAERRINDHLNEQNERLEQSLRQQQVAEHNLSEQLARLDVLAQTAGQNLEHRVTALLETASAEMARRTEGVMAAWTGRVQLIQEATSREIDRLSNQLKAELSSGLDSAGEMLRNIENAAAAAKESLRSTQENFARTSHSLIGNSERQIEESGRATTAKWVAEIENRATDATYTTFELLFKASEWYGKKLQTQIETTLEKGLEQAAGNLREKAEAAFREFGVKADAAADQLSSLLQMQSAHIRATSEAEGQQLAAEFRAALTQAQSTVSKASQDLLAEVRLAQDAVRLETRPQANELNDTIAQLGDQAIKAYEKRLEDVSNLSLQNAVSRFSQESEEHLETLVRSAEQRLRQTCNEVFMEIGETLRQSLLEPKLPRPAAKETHA